MTWTILPAGTSASIAFKAHELLMAVALHVAADDGPGEDVELSEQGRGAMALVVVRHGAEPALLQRQARLGPAHDLVGANTAGAREDDRRPPSVFLQGVTVPGDRFKSAADGPRDRMEIPVRMRRTEESQSGLFCQATTTIARSHR